MSNQSAKSGDRLHLKGRQIQLSFANKVLYGQIVLVTERERNTNLFAHEIKEFVAQSTNRRQKLFVRKPVSRTARTAGTDCDNAKQ